MTTGKLPPQAFTNHEVTKAMRWLDSQPKHIKIMAETTDSLMALYRQAMLYGSEFYEKYPPMSEEKFRNDLNQLASQLSSFGEKSMPEQNSQVLNLEEEPPKRLVPQPETIKRTFVEEMPAKRTYKTEEAPRHSYVEREKVQISMERERREERNTKISDLLDPSSNQKLTEIKQRLNLSSETEVARMLISLGYERLKDI